MQAPWAGIMKHAVSIRMRCKSIIPPMDNGMKTCADFRPVSNVCQLLRLNSPVTTVVPPFAAVRSAAW